MRIDLRHAERDLNGRLLPIGEGSGHAGERTHSGSVGAHSLPSFVPDRRRDILQAVYETGGAVRLSEIGESVGLKKSGYLRRLVDDLVERGYLIRIPAVWRNGCLMYLYDVAQ